MIPGVNIMLREQKKTISQHRMSHQLVQTEEHIKKEIGASTGWSRMQE